MLTRTWQPRTATNMGIMFLFGGCIFKVSVLPLTLPVIQLVSLSTCLLAGDTCLKGNYQQASTRLQDELVQPKRLQFGASDGRVQPLAETDQAPPNKAEDGMEDPDEPKLLAPIHIHQPDGK